MHVIELDPAGIHPVRPVLSQTSGGRFIWSYVQGPAGHLHNASVWVYRFPLHMKDFSATRLSVPNGPYTIHPLLDEDGNQRTDSKGNMMMLLRRSEDDDGKQLVFWSLSRLPTDRVEYSIYGDAEELGRATASSTMYDHEYPVVLVNGKCSLVWDLNERTFKAVYDGKRWELSYE